MQEHGYTHLQIVCCKVVHKPLRELSAGTLEKPLEEVAPRLVCECGKHATIARVGFWKGGWTVRPHWRRGHIRRLADGRVIPIPPCCVNMEDGVPVKPEYVVKI